MQFRDLPKQYEKLKAQIDAAITSVAASAHFISGPEVKELENALADYVGVKHCITCANGTDAITIAMRTWGIGKGDAVFVPDFTFSPLENAPRTRGLRQSSSMLTRGPTTLIRASWRKRSKKQSRKGNTGLKQWWQ